MFLFHLATRSSTYDLKLCDDKILHMEKDNIQNLWSTICAALRNKRTETYIEKKISSTPLATFVFNSISTLSYIKQFRRIFLFVVLIAIIETITINS